jgi:hypothetical protein
MNKKLIITAASVAFAIAGSLHASNNLGDHYIEVGAAYISPEGGLDSAGALVSYNRPLSDHIDLQFQVTGETLVEGPYDGNAGGAHAGLTYYDTYDQMKGFIGATAGYVYAEIEGFSNDAFAYSVFVGAEFELSPQFTLTVAGGWNDTAESPGTVFGTGKLSWHVTESVSLGGQVTYDYDNDDDVGLFIYGLGVAFQI